MKRYSVIHKGQWSWHSSLCEDKRSGAVMQAKLSTYPCPRAHTRGVRAESADPSELRGIKREWGEVRSMGLSLDRYCGTWWTLDIRNSYISVIVELKFFSCDVRTMNTWWMFEDLYSVPGESRVGDGLTYYWALWAILLENFKLQWYHGFKCMCFWVRKCGRSSISVSIMKTSSSIVRIKKFT